MTKKELILTVAKDLIIGGRMYTDGGISADHQASEAGKLLEAVAKEVERVYDVIKES